MEKHILIDNKSIKLDEFHSKLLHCLFTEINYGLYLERYFDNVFKNYDYSKNIETKISDGKVLDNQEFLYLIYFISIMIIDVKSELNSRTGYNLIDFINLQNYLLCQLES